MRCQLALIPYFLLKARTVMFIILNGYLGVFLSKLTIQEGGASSQISLIPYFIYSILFLQLIARFLVYSCYKMAIFIEFDLFCQSEC